METIEQQRANWGMLFKKHEIKCDVESLTIPKWSKGLRQLIVVPKIDHNRLCELFKEKLSEHKIVSFIAPLQTSWPGEKRFRTYQFSDLVHENIRTAESEPYVIFAKRHVSFLRGRLVKTSTFDNRLTVVEAFLYHLYWLNSYGEEYLALHFYDYQTCLGSHGPRGTPGLRWDLQDIKVCLDFH